MFPILLSYLACTSSKEIDSAQNIPSDSAIEQVDPGPEPNAEQPAPSLRRLTISQYRNIIFDIFSADIVIPSSLEPDTEVDGFLNIGASISNISPVGIERYESASYSIAEQLVENETLLATLLPCQSVTEIDQECWEEFLSETGALLWRRPLSEVEISTLSGLMQTISAESDHQTGLIYLISALLQSPNFLYRVEQGNNGVLSDIELASRLSFLLWNSAPDAQLLSIALEGGLSDPEQREAEVDRMMADSKFEQGLRNFFLELFQLYALDDVVKDPLVFTHASPDLYQSAKEETLLFLLNNVIEREDYRDILTAQKTFVDRRLAALYNIAAPSAEGFGEVTLSETTNRRGLLMQASILNLNAHATSTSATLRGIFIRKNLLCQMIPAPPANVDTSIPEADAESPTLRERLQSHLEDPSCATCHEITDLVGLGFENFDGIGRWRNTENNATIDPSGSIDNISFLDAWELAGVVKEHNNFGPCISEKLYQYALGHQTTDQEEEFVDWMATYLAASDWSLQDLIRQLALSENFKHAGAQDD